jgi:hypothetical protein
VAQSLLLHIDLLFQLQRRIHFPFNLLTELDVLGDISWLDLGLSFPFGYKFKQ